MRSKRILVCLLTALLAVPMSIHASGFEPERLSTKDNDVQLRAGFEFDKKVNRWLSVAWSEELRLKSNFTSLDRIYSDLSLGFKPTKWLKINADYTFIAIDHDGKKKTNFERYWDLRHRVTAGVTFTHKTLTNWEFSLKERVVTTFLTGDKYDKNEKCSPNVELRSKLMAAYKVRPVPVIPYVFVELCNTLRVPELDIDGNYLNKVRSGVGVQYRFNKRNCIDFSYRFDYNLDHKLKVNKAGLLKSVTDAKEFNNIFSVSYKYKF